jgi:L-rhamnose mutarotase
MQFVRLKVLNKTSRKIRSPATYPEKLIGLHVWDELVESLHTQLLQHYNIAMRNQNNMVAVRRVKEFERIQEHWEKHVQTKQLKDWNEFMNNSNLLIGGYKEIKDTTVEKVKTEAKEASDSNCSSSSTDSDSDSSGSSSSGSEQCSSDDEQTPVAKRQRVLMHPYPSQIPSTSGHHSKEDCPATKSPKLSSPNLNLSDSSDED